MSCYVNLQDLLWIGSDPFRTFRLLEPFGSNVLLTGADLKPVFNSSSVTNPLSIRLLVDNLSSFCCCECEQTTKRPIHIRRNANALLLMKTIFFFLSSNIWSPVTMIILVCVYIYILVDVVFC